MAVCFLSLAADLGHTGSKLSLSPPLSHRLRPPGPPAQPELGRRQRLHPRVSQELCLPCLDSHCPADLGYIAEELLRGVWSWTGARLVAPAAGRGCRSCSTQTVSLGCEGGRGAQIAAAAGSPRGKELHPLRLKETGAAVSVLFFPQRSHMALISWIMAPCAAAPA